MPEVSYAPAHVTEQDVSTVKEAASDLSAKADQLQKDSRVRKLLDDMAAQLDALGRTLRPTH